MANFVLAKHLALRSKRLKGLLNKLRKAGYLLSLWSSDELSEVTQVANKIAPNGKGRDFFTYLLSSADLSGKYKRLTNVFPDKPERDRVIVFDDTPGTKAAYTERKHFVRVPTWDGVKQDTVLDTLCAALEKLGPTVDLRNHRSELLAAMPLPPRR